MPERKIPAIFKEIIDDLEATDDRKFEVRRNNLKHQIDNLLDKKGFINKDGFRTTPRVVISEGRKRYEFWVEEGQSTELSSGYFGINFLIMVQPIENQITEALVAYRFTDRNIFDIVGYQLDEDDNTELEEIKEMVDHFQMVLPDSAELSSDGQRGNLHSVRTRKDTSGTASETQH